MEIFKVLQEKLGEEVFTEELMDDLKAQVDVIVAEKLQEQKQTLTEKLEEELELRKQELEESLRAEADEYKNELVESIDGYLEYASKEFLKENSVAIEKEFTVKAAKELIEKFADILESNHFSVDTDQLKKLEAMEEKLAKVEDKLKEVVKENIDLKGDITEYEKCIKFTSITEGLSKAKVDKVLGLIEGMEFKDMKDFERKVKLCIEKVQDKPEGKTELKEDIDNKEVIKESKKEIKESDIDKYL